MRSKIQDITKELDNVNKILARPKVQELNKTLLDFYCLIFGHLQQVIECANDIIENPDYTDTDEIKTVAGCTLIKILVNTFGWDGIDTLKPYLEKIDSKEKYAQICSGEMDPNSRNCEILFGALTDTQIPLLNNNWLKAVFDPKSQFRTHLSKLKTLDDEGSLQDCFNSAQACSRHALSLGQLFYLQEICDEQIEKLSATSLKM